MLFLAASVLFPAFMVKAMLALDSPTITSKNGNKSYMPVLFQSECSSAASVWHEGCKTLNER